MTGLGSETISSPGTEAMKKMLDASNIPDKMENVMEDEAARLAAIRKSSGLDLEGPVVQGNIDQETVEP